MADSTGIDKGLRELTQADFDGPAKIGNAISDLAKAEYRMLSERWSIGSASRAQPRTAI